MIQPPRAVVDRYPAQARPTSVASPLGNGGGFSGASLWRYDSGLGPLALKAWPADGPGPDGLRAIHDCLARTADLGFIPVPIRTLDGATLVEAEGRLWEVDRWMPGEADARRPPPASRIGAMFAGLAAFHARLASTATAGPSPGIAARVAELEQLLLGEFEELDGAVSTRPDDPRSPMAREWISRAQVVAPEVLARIRVGSKPVVRLQPCLRDARADHFLFEGDRLTGLVDFGAMGRDTVAGDLARLIGEAIGTDRPSRAVALAAFEAIRPIDPAEYALIAHFERANALLGAGRWVRWHFLDRRTFDDPEAIGRGLRRCLERFEEVFGRVCPGGSSLG